MGGRGRGRDSRREGRALACPRPPRHRSSNSQAPPPSAQHVPPPGAPHRPRTHRAWVCSTPLACPHAQAFDCVCSEAVCVACHLIGRMLADSPADVVQRMAAAGCKLAIIGRCQVTTDIPEHAYLKLATGALLSVTFRHFVRVWCLFVCARATAVTLRKVLSYMLRARHVPPRPLVGVVPPAGAVVYRSGAGGYLVGHRFSSRPQVF
jgi:hypothetical protein